MKKNRIYPLAVMAALYLIWRIAFFTAPESELIHLQGTTMGTISYSIKYIDKENRAFQKEIDSILVAFNNSLSTYIPSSEISQLNTSGTIKFRSPFFYPVLEMSREVHDNSHGAFDPTIGPLVNAWGFGPKKVLEMDSSSVDSLLQIVGFDKVIFDAQTATMNPNMYLDFSAVAKGNAIDVIGGFLSSKGIENFMVEIGGEVTCRGNNQHKDLWAIGIEKPQINAESQGAFAIVTLDNKALATSGNYRNYYIKDGKTISHTINPKTGYPATHNLLSASIIAENCTLADAYATASMVMGYEAAKLMVERVKGIECVLIYTNEKGGMSSFVSKGIASKVELLRVD